MLLTGSASRIFFFYIVSDLGIPYFYTCVGNLVAVVVLQYSIDAKRPIDYDDSLYEHACTDPDTKGFPSVDSHMVIVVIGPALTSPAVSATTIALMVVSGLIIAFTRVFVGVRFPSQIVGSWGTGVMGVLVANFIHVSVLHHASTAALPASFHRVVVVCVIVAALFCMASWVEASDSRNFGIPRHEFSRVLKTIVTSGTDDVAPTTDGSSHRRDSFYYLMKSVHSRRRPDPAAAVQPPRVHFAAAVPEQQGPKE
ncbi:hypothetical protein, variant [Aphanomyces invadans]|uniref:Phosphatidic acid phosphatase type 2/haloperoxidase domain-containing protein n=1 Tax=Aphanomyces invadans TaxID=157072 RepID=A0A024UUB1_9STRA|nr:hypothetical protein, variant [Aphanomyces invadans]ETW09540.1 hypothetical protein, variant [Aphanomyces invadans]|eukprot:XP_008860951.1 hypothetical protein, variant [Aphanomyces invadans]